MEVKKVYTETTEKTIDITCDICGQTARSDCWLAPHGKLYSENNGNNLACDMCEQCWWKVTNFIKMLGGQIREGY